MKSATTDTNDILWEAHLQSDYFVDCDNDSINNSLLKKIFNLEQSPIPFVYEDHVWHKLYGDINLL